MWIKKTKCILLLSFLFSLPCFTQELTLDVTKLGMNSLWNSVEMNLQSLESEQQFSQTRLIELEKKLESSEKALESRELLLQNLESSLQKSERDLKKWKTCSIVLCTATVVLIAVMVNSK